MHRLSLSVPGAPDKFYELSAEEMILGRESGVHIQVPDPSVSRRHARLAWHGGQFWIEDLGSSNGTYVNGQRLAGPYPLQRDDQIGLG